MPDRSGHLSSNADFSFESPTYNNCVVGFISNQMLQVAASWRSEAMPPAATRRRGARPAQERHDGARRASGLCAACRRTTPWVPPPPSRLGETSTGDGLTKVFEQRLATESRRRLWHRRVYPAPPPVAPWLQPTPLLPVRLFAVAVLTLPRSRPCALSFPLRALVPARAGCPGFE